jgi:hypothetical protein
MDGQLIRDHPRHPREFPALSVELPLSLPAKLFCSPLDFGDPNSSA